MFSGIGKTARELALAVDEGILCVNVESEAELELLSSIAAGKGRAANISVRVNPDVDAEDPRQDRDRQGREQVRHPDQPRARGLCARREACRASRSPASTCISAARSPSCSRSTTPSRCCPISCARLRADGHAIAHVDLGGGLGIPYRDDNEPPPHPDAYAAMVKRATRDLGCTLIFEPGRLIVGNAGILVTRVLYLKRGEAKTFVIVDAGMNDLIRPTLYEAHHEIRPVRAAAPQATGGSSPTWSARSANRAISWPSTATCRSRSPAICWRS